MKFNDFLKSHLGKKVVSVILGFGLATLFYRSCKEDKCIQFVGAPPSEIKDKVFRYNDKCFRFKQVAKKCNPQKRQLHFTETREGH